MNLYCNKAQNNPLFAEVPYLLHPEIDDPVHYFRFEIANDGTGIRLIGIDNAQRGAKTIEICKLNRLELTLDRVISVIDNFKESIEACFALFIRGEMKEDVFVQSIRNQITTLKAQANNVEKTHTFLRKYIVENRLNFKTIVIPFLIQECQKVVMQAFDTSN